MEVARIESGMSRGCIMSLCGGNAPRVVPLKGYRRIAKPEGSSM